MQNPLGHEVYLSVHLSVRFNGKIPKSNLTLLCELYEQTSYRQQQQQLEV